MRNLSKSIILTIALVAVALFVVPPSWAADDAQEDRIKKMGFVSITDSDTSEKAQELPEAVEKRIPQPKVINIPPKSPNPYVKENAKATSPNKKLTKNENLPTTSSFIELDSPIMVYGEGPAPVVTPEKEMLDVALSDDEIKATAAAVIKENDPVKKAQDYGFQEEPQEHKEEAYNYYNYDKNESNFKSVDLNSTGIKTISPADLERREKGQVEDPIVLKYRSKSESQGVPLVDANISVTTGYRVDDLDWNIAGNLLGSDPNILSELTWDDLQMVEVKGKVNVVLNNYLVLDGKAGWGEIIDGKNQDSDYDGDNRTSEFSRSNNATDEGHVWDYSLGGGFRFPVDDLGYLFTEENMWVSVLGGYSRHKQHLIISNGNQTVPDLGSFPGLNSRYTAQWDGPWLGIELTGSFRKWRGWGRFEYHFPEYEGDATWNLREEFVQPGSFIHFADDGRGIVFEGGGYYQLTEMWSFTLAFTLQDWEMNPGIDRTYFTNGAIIDTRLNEVNWDSLSLTAGLTARF